MFVTTILRTQASSPTRTFFSRSCVIGRGEPLSQFPKQWHSLRKRQPRSEESRFRRPLSGSQWACWLSDPSSGPGFSFQFPRESPHYAKYILLTTLCKAETVENRGRF